MARYRKRPVIIEAFKWTGGPDQTEDPVWAIKAMEMPWGELGAMRVVKDSDDIHMEIHTLEGVHVATVGSFIIQGVEGEVYSCKADIFEKTYEPVEEQV